MQYRFIDGLSDIIEDYDALFVDLWGCVVDGKRAFPPAIACLRSLRASGRRVVLMTNVPRPADVIVDRLAGMGVVDDCYDALVTSGDATIHALNRREDAWHAAFGKRYFHIGANPNDELLRHIDGVETGIDAADYILVTGFPGREKSSPADYDDVFTAGRRRGLPLVCANPDRASSHGDRIVYRAGAVAERYAEKHGGDVRYHGKPDAGIYRLGFEKMGPVDRERVLMIGDNLATDILGARAIGIDAVWIVGGLHAEEVGLAPDAPLDPVRIGEILDTADARPRAIMATLRW
jgi:HAD superfamily hydrolase (TIGR01459 family)